MTDGDFESEAVFVGLEDEQGDDGFVQVRRITEPEPKGKEMANESKAVLVEKASPRPRVETASLFSRSLAVGSTWIILVALSCVLQNAFPGAPYDANICDKNTASVYAPTIPLKAPRTSPYLKVLDAKTSHNFTDISEKRILYALAQDLSAALPILHKVADTFGPAGVGVVAHDCSIPACVQARESLLISWFERGQLKDENSGLELTFDSLFNYVKSRLRLTQAMPRPSMVFMRSRSFLFVNNSTGTSSSVPEQAVRPVADRLKALARYDGMNRSRSKNKERFADLTFEPIRSPLRNSIGSSMGESNKPQPRRHRNMDSQILAVMNPMMVPVISPRKSRMAKAASTISCDPIETTEYNQIPRPQKAEIPMVVSSTVTSSIMETSKRVEPAQPEFTVDMLKPGAAKKKTKKKRHQRQRNSASTLSEQNNDNATAMEAPSDRGPRDDTVQYLTRETFQDVITGNQHVFVNFFIHWCRWCSFHPIPTWKKLSDHVAEWRMPVVIAAVDCIENVAFCLEQSVSNLSTLRWYDQGNATEYEKSKDGRTEHDLFSFVQRKSMVAASTKRSSKKKASKAMTII